MEVMSTPLERALTFAHAIVAATTPDYTSPAHIVATALIEAEKQREHLMKAIGTAPHPDSCRIWGPRGKTPYTVEQWALDGKCSCWIDAAREKA